jgi:hypothetical protein
MYSKEDSAICRKMVTNWGDICIEKKLLDGLITCEVLFISDHTNKY